MLNQGITMSHVLDMLCSALQYLKHARVLEEYILVLDSDMLIRRPILPRDFGVTETEAASENMW